MRGGRAAIEKPKPTRDARTDISVSIVNIVADFRLPGPLVLSRLVGELDATYEPEIHSNAYLRLDAGATAIFHQKGRIAIAGAKSEQHLAECCVEITQRLSTIGIRVGDEKPQMRNVVGVFDLGERIPLSDLAKAGVLDYDPESFPAGYLRKLGGKGMALVYGSGKVVLTGFQSPGAVRAAAHETRDRLTAQR